MKRRHNLCFWLTLLCCGMAAWSAWRWYSGSESAAFSLAVNLIGVGICWWFAFKVRAINRDIAAIEEETEKIKAARATDALWQEMERRYADRLLTPPEDAE